MRTKELIGDRIIARDDLGMATNICSTEANEEEHSGISNSQTEDVWHFQELVTVPTELSWEKSLSKRDDQELSSRDTVWWWDRVPEG